MIREEFPSLMRDKENRIWLVQPLVEERHYMVCLGTFSDSEGSSGEGFGNMQSIKGDKLKKYFTHMKKGFFIEIEQGK